MNTRTTWTVKLQSLAPLSHTWQGHFLGMPSHLDIQDALSTETIDGPSDDPTSGNGYNICGDLGPHIPRDYADKSQGPHGYNICVARVVIGILYLTKQVTYEVC